MSSLACSWAWLLGGLLGGWLLWQLFDKFFRRDGEAAGLRVRRDLEAANTRLNAMQSELSAAGDKHSRTRAELDAANAALAAKTSEFDAMVADWKAKHADVSGKLSLETAAAAAAAAAAATALAGERDAHAGVRSELEAATASLATRTDDVARLSAELADWKAKHNKVKDEVDAALLAAATANANADAAKKAAAEGHARLQAELASANEALAKLRAELSAANQAHEKVKGEHAASVSALAALRTEHDASVAAHETLKAEHAAALDSHGAVKLELASVHESHGKVKGELAVAAAALVAANEGHTRLRGELATANDHAATLRSELAAANDATAKVRGELATLHDATAKLRAELAAAQERVTSVSAERDSLRGSLSARTEEAAGLGRELAECRAKHASLAEEMSKASASAASAQAFAAAAEFGFTPRRNGRDDLLIIEGIGPKINELLIKDGIDTFAKLAVAPVDRVQAILTAAGPNFRLANPASWARQAEMCQRGAWSELRAYQDTLRAGVDASRAAKRDEEKWLASAKEFGFAPRRNGKDDLIIIEGIGPKINELLIAGGIDTFAKLASTPVEKVQAILDAAGPNFRLANPASWAQQSAMCDAGQWKELKALQDTLRAGVDTGRDA